MTLTGNNPITVNGTYVLDVIPGQQYLVNAKGTWGAAGTISVSYTDPVTGLTVAFLNNSFTANSEFFLVAPSDELVLVTTGSGYSIGFCTTPTNTPL